MSPDEVIETLARFDAAWPTRGLTHETVALWTEHLANVDPSFGEAAANALLGESKFYPSVAEFKARSRDFARRNVMKFPALPSHEVVPTAEEAHRRIQELRDVLAKTHQR